MKLCADDVVEAHNGDIARALHVTSCSARIAPMAVVSLKQISAVKSRVACVSRLAGS
jgi:hypothetical protein